MNNPDTVRTFPIRRRIVALLVAIILLSQATFAAPEAARTVVVAASEGYTDAAFAWQNHYAGTLTKLLPTSLASFVSAKPTPPDVVRIAIFPKGIDHIREGQPLDLAAIAYSVHDNPVPGVKFQWTIEDQGRGKTRHLATPRFTPQFSGHYMIVAHAGNLEARVPIIVDDDPGLVLKRRVERMLAKGDRSLLNSLKAAHQYATSELSSKKNYGVPQSQQTEPDSVSPPAAHGPSASDSERATDRTKNRRMLLMRPADDDGWDNSNWWMADDPNNQPGNQPGGSPAAGAANGNFQFSAPVVSAPGRGIDIALSLNYNARVWSKAGNTMSFDAERGYPAPGWNLGFGKMMFMGTSGGCMLIDADGTNRSYTGTVTTYSGYGFSYTTFDGHTTDGSFIDYSCASTAGGTSLYGNSSLPNGTKISYGSTSVSGQQAFPGTISDAQGNYIQVNYKSAHGPAIDTITDTLGRVYTFNYDSSNRLISVSVPQYNSSTARTAIQLHYKSITLAPGWAYPITGDTNNSSPDVIDAIYYPGTSTGYWFGADSTASDYGTYYSDYGMLTKIIEQRGMAWSGTSGTQGSVSAGTMSKQVLYDFPQHADYTLTDAPTYSNVTESWDQMDTSAAVTHYVPNMSASPRTITVTQPNGLKSTQYMYNASGLWNDGLIFEDDTLDASNNLLGKSVVTWAQGDYGAPRPTETDVYDEKLQMLKTTYTYGTSYNQVTSQKSWDYDGSTLLKEVRNSYQNDSHYISNHIFSLVTTNEVYNGSGNRVAKTDYEYDNNIVVTGTGSTDLANTSGVTMHYDTYDPHTTDTHEEDTTSCEMWDPDYGADPACTYEGEEVTVWPAGPYEAECKCTQYEQTEVSNYVPSTDYRGNLTKTTVYPDAATPSGGIAETKRYDETGNVVAESASCCELKSYTYTTGTDYAYPTSMSRGSSDTSSTIRNTSTAAYDYNTGLITLSTDPNSRTTTTAYDANTLRPTQTTSPTGAYSLTTYDESGMTITDEVHDSSAALAGKTITYLNGIGQTKRTDTITGSTIDISQTMYDNLARVWKESRPYRSGDTVYWTEKTYDLLGRVSQITGPDGSTTKAFYNETSRPDSASSNLGSTVRVQDAWGRERWGRYDALDRLVEVAEPNPAGSGSSNGAVLATGGSAPNSLITNYTFDTLGNLTQSNQGGQVRSFKYDSLGRLTRQKLAEETATLDDTGTYVPPDISGVRAGANWSSAFTYDSRSNVTQKVDARGVIATYAYGVGGADDPLNRLQSVSYAPGTTYDTSKPIPPAKSVAYQYMPSGDQDRLQKITVDSTLTDELAYDTEGRVSDVTRTFLTHATYPMVTSYTYDSLNRTTDELDAAKYGLTGSPRKHIQNTFDASSRQTTLTVDGSVQANSVVYNAADQITSFHTSSVAASGNSFTESYTYDPQTGLLTRQKVLLSNRTASLDLSYDYSRNNSAGSLTGQTGQLTKVLNNLDHNKDREYQFDAIGRLTVAKGKATSQWTQNYTFDRWGNRTAVSSSGTAADGSTIPNDGIPALSYDTGNNRITTPGWEYDVAGNQTRALSQDGTNFIRYEYDAANCPVNIKDDSGNVIQSQQFGEGNDRISLTDASASQITYYDGPTEYTEAVGTGVLSWSRSLVYFGDSLLSTATPSVSGSEITEYNHPDGLGARLFSTPGTFHTVAEQAHLPFGNALDAESTRTSFSKRFTSYERSATTGFDYAQNRTYDSRQGRFTQVDPVGMGDVSLDSPQSLNLYSYCQNDPINYRDPSGLGFFSFLKKLFKWLAIIVAVAVIVASVVISHGAASGLLANLADLFAKLGLVSLVSGETAAVSIGISGQIILAAASVGAIDDFAQTKKKKPSPEDVRRRLIRSAINSALWRLRHMPGCKEFVQGNSTIDPIATLEVLRDSGRIFYDPKLGSVSSDGPVAQVPASDVRKGAWSTIHLGDKWFDKKVGGWAGTMNTMRTRTGTILHETKHTVDKGHEDGEANDYYYKEIAKRCFGVTPSH